MNAGKNEILDQELSGLMARAQDGDAPAYRDLLLRLKSLASNFARAFNSRAGWGQDSEWEDAVQDILIALHEKRRTYDPSQPFLPWFYAIARYKLIDRYRSRKRMWARLPSLEEFNLEEIAADESSLPSMAQSDLEALMTELPDKQREVLVLVKLEGLSVAEAARKLNISESDVKVSVHRAMKSLRARLEEKGGPNG